MLTLRLTFTFWLTLVLRLTLTFWLTLVLRLAFVLVLVLRLLLTLAFAVRRWAWSGEAVNAATIESAVAMRRECLGFIGSSPVGSTSAPSVRRERSCGPRPAAKN